MSNDNEINKALKVIKNFGYNQALANKYPKDLPYYFLNSEFKKLKKTTRTELIKQYGLIITNELHRELIFHGIFCTLTPKEYFLVKYLLENHSFHNKNFTQIPLQYSINEKKLVRKKCKYKLTKDLKKTKNSNFLIKNYDKCCFRKLLKQIRKNSKFRISIRKKTMKNKLFKSDNKSEISNYRNKIKTKIQENMIEQNITIENFDYKFECLMRTKYYNYDFEFPNNSYQTLVTSYCLRHTRQRVSKRYKL